jgi:hypothetical protein
MDDDKECAITKVFRDAQDRAHREPKCPNIKTLAECFCHIELWSPKWDLMTLRTESANVEARNQLSRALVARMEHPTPGEYSMLHAVAARELSDRVRQTSGYCTRHSVNQVYHREPEALFVVPTEELAQAVAEMQSVVGDSHMYFSLIRFADGSTKVYAKYNRIIGSRLLAWIHIETKDWAPSMIDDLFGEPSDYHPTE